MDKEIDLRSFAIYRTFSAPRMLRCLNPRDAKGSFDLSDML